MSTRDDYRLSNDDGKSIVGKSGLAYEETLQNAEHKLRQYKNDRMQQLLQLGDVLLRLDHASPKFDTTKDLVLKKQLEATSTEL